ncbi:MAG: hypothetical protein H9872_10715 [Candidatus Cellulosilyticum pullistercoris]|uniref:RNA-binding S4 domain-containing protein n=1 Tax=Candidatus Cellulosilyticum pullistercoris TaxID=2838521 RepID=A0A9E2KDQ0_9FIRM|nr:hypothetical protein [Candidatus Cellulosilyticum pullistercoris]
MTRTYDHIKGIEEKQFVRMITDYVYRADKQNRPFFTEFYNKEWMESILNQYCSKQPYVSYTFFGGYEGAERQRLGVTPYELSHEDFGIGALDIKVKTGLGKALSHRDYLGAILGLGIERDRIGDIIPYELGAYVIVCESMIPYIRSQLLTVGRYQKVTVEEIPLSQLTIIQPKTKEVSTTVSALRMDAVTAAAFGLSRSEAAKLIQGDKARRNGVSVSLSDLLKEGDTITLRGYGKIKLKTVNGYTKKERLHITIEKYV